MWAFAGRVLEGARPRNKRLVDWWSLTHVVWAIGLSILIGPLFALVVMTLWEPLEVLLLSPLLAKRGFDFGHESLRNSLMDVVFNTLGVLLAVFFVLPFVDPLWTPAWP